MIKTVKVPADYKLIAMWHNTSYPYYIKDMQYKAYQEQAPIDSVYKSHEGEWVRLGNIANVELRNELITKLAHKVADAY